jgi:poly(A) polymerase
MRRLGALGVWVKEDAERLRSRLRLSGAESERLLALEHWWRVVPDPDAQPAHALLYRLGPQSFLDRALVAWTRSDAGAADNNWRQLASLPRRWIVPSFPLKAADFVERGVAAGPQLGNALRAAKKAWIAADFPADRAVLNKIADDAARGTAFG